MNDRGESPSSEARVVWREGDELVIDRTVKTPLPDLCPFSGEPATRRIPCVFHKQKRYLAGGGLPALVILSLIEHYFSHVDKALVWIPLSPRLYRRWWCGWGLTALGGLAAIATIAGLWFGQQAVDAMPKGDARTFWRDLGIPLVALGGFAVIAVFTLIAYKIMPTPTVQLKVVSMTDERLRLQGASAEYLAALDRLATSR